jgi:hypothetical protein
MRIRDHSPDTTFYIFRQECLIVFKESTISALSHPLVEIFVSLGTKDCSVTVDRNSPGVSTQEFQRCIPGAIPGGVVNQDDLKVFENVLMKDALQALSEIPSLVVIDKDADQRIVRVVLYRVFIHLALAIPFILSVF